MADPSNSPHSEPAHPGPTPGAPVGPDPESADRFGEIIDPNRAAAPYSIHPQERGLDLKRGKLGIANWVMAVIAGLVLGIVLTMIAAT